jgi:hypothetical protein
MDSILGHFVFDLSAFFTAISIAFAAWMWGTVWRYKYAVPIWDISRIFTVAFTFQLLIYIFFSFLLVDVTMRVYLVRVSIVVICLAQAVPLMATYRVWLHER